MDKGVMVARIIPLRIFWHIIKVIVKVMMRLTYYTEREVIFYLLLVHIQA